MKTWSKHWKTSKKPRKQRKYVHNIPVHLKGKLLSSTLTKDLRKKHRTRNIRIHKGDKAKIMRGQHRGKTGTVERVEVKKMKVYISGAEITKRDGSKALYPIHPSNIMITELTQDKRRMPQNKETKK
ncbi:50S ribosomal protein L24 [Candidatus Woesearchaeota archaeon]|nr:50S ribosomal protein L24 [Candidatus Woesearchaeota archaeon]